MKKKIFQVLSLLILLVGNVLLPSKTASALQDEIVPVNILLMYSPDCQECKTLLEKDIPDAIKQYGERVQILSIDITQPGNQQIYRSLVDKFGLKNKPLPIAVVGDSVFVGVDEIRAGIPAKIQELLEAGGANLAIGNEVPPEPDRSIFFITLLFLGVIFAFAIGWGRTNNSYKDLRKKKVAVDKDNTELRGHITNVEQENEELKKKITILEHESPIDPTMNALLGIVNSPVDYLAEAIRIIYFTDKRPAELTVRDVNGYLISLLKMLASATGIEIIGYYQKIVEFDSRIHASHEYIDDKTTVKIVEVGWKKKDVILKKAVVEKIPVQQKPTLNSMHKG